MKAVERPARARDLRRRGLHGRGQPWPLGAMAQAVEAPSAMDGSAVGRRARELFSLLSRFGRAAVTIYLQCVSCVRASVTRVVRSKFKIQEQNRVSWCEFSESAARHVSMKILKTLLRPGHTSDRAHAPGRAQGPPQWLQESTDVCFVSALSRVEQTNK